MTLRGLRVTLGEGRVGKVGGRFLWELARSAPRLSPPHQPANGAGGAHPPRRVLQTQEPFGTLVGEGPLAETHPRHLLDVTGP